MIDQINRYTKKLIAEKSATYNEIAFAANDDKIVSIGEERLSEIAKDSLSKLNAIAICAAKPALPFYNFIFERNRDEKFIVPRDTETRTFLHDIPLVSKSEFSNYGADIIAKELGSRKGIVVEDTGIIAVGALTVEQAYINWSSLFHAIFIKFLEDILESGAKSAEEHNSLVLLKRLYLSSPLSALNLTFRERELSDKNEILDEICRVGKYTVDLGLVDSFFGNISYRCNDLIYISQTASSLDNLAGCIDPVPFTNSSTVGITASSELAAHRSIYEQSDCKAVLHGHPRFSVIMSMQCDKRDICRSEECWKRCDFERTICNTPIVAGEIGAGGLAKNVPPAISRYGNALVYGHGVFSAGQKGFKEALTSMIKIENHCREEYFKKYEEKWGCL